MSSNTPTKIWIDKEQVAANHAAKRSGYNGPPSPVFKVKRSTGIVRANGVDIKGPSRLVYECGSACASAWVEVPAGVEVVLW